MMHRLDPIRIQMRGNRLHALPLARQQQPGAIAVQPLFLLGMVHRCGERIHVFVELLFFTALTTLCAHALNIETSAAPSARQAMRVSGKLPLSDVCYSRIMRLAEASGIVHEELLSDNAESLALRRQRRGDMEIQT